jgi:hypothetical protein
MIIKYKLIGDNNGFGHINTMLFRRSKPSSHPHSPVPIIPDFIFFPAQLKSY